MTRSTVVSILLLALVGLVSAQAPSENTGVGITFEQTSNQVVFDFQVDNATFNRVYYNTSVRGGETIVKVVFESENENNQKFVRLHLARAILPSSTSATTTEEGAKITFSKADPGETWANVVNFASDEALQGTLPVNVAGNNVEITASEYEDLNAVVARSLEKVEGVQYSEADVQQIAQLFDDAFDKTTPYCLASSFCLCKAPYVFDGTKCVPGDTWVEFGRKVVSQSAVQVQEEEDKPMKVLTEKDLLDLEETSFNTIFDTYQRRAASQQVWPYLLYAQTFKNSRVLVVGGGMTQFEPLVLANSGCNVTIIDTNLDNLKLLNRIADASSTPRSRLHLAYVPSFDGLEEVEGDFDAVLVLDSLTKAPTEMLSEVYAALLSKLRLGGRWIQLAPSKSRYLSEGSPSYRDFAKIYNRHLGLDEEVVWYEWLDVQKLMSILSSTKTRFQVVFEGELGSQPSQFPDNFQFIDLLYLGQAFEKK